jgi:hypothetical protein
MHAFHSQEPAVWARTPPADRTNIFRAVAADLFDQKARVKLQAIEDRCGSLEVEGTRLCSPSTYDEQERAVHDDTRLASNEDVVVALGKIKARRDLIPQFRERIQAETNKEIDRMAPSALALLRVTLDRVRSQIAEFKASDQALFEFWGVAAREDSWNFFLYALQRLESILVVEVSALTAYKPEHGEQYGRPALIDAGVIVQKAVRRY